MRYEHLLLTRFAVLQKIFDGVPGPRRLSAEWIAERLDLFRRYCVPSVQAQTVQTFRWFVFVHAGIDPTVMMALRACDPRIVVTSDPMTPLRPSEGDLVISTRLDSDDALHPNALQTVEAFVPAFMAGEYRTRVVQLRHGYYVDPHRQMAYLGHGWSYLSLIEWNVGPRLGVLQESCDTLHKHYRTWTVLDPLWLRVVHGGNLRNRFEPKTRRVVPLVDLVEDYPFLQAVAA